jgi:hypothetical protein
MSHWPFILGAYGIAALGTLWLLVASFLSMRRAEAEADELRSER